MSNDKLQEPAARTVITKFEWVSDGEGNFLGTVESQLPLEENTSLYTAPPSAAQAVEAAIRKAADLFYQRGMLVSTEDARAMILALIPADAAQVEAIDTGAIHDAGVHAAREGVQEVFTSLGDDGKFACPDEWHEKPLLRIQWDEDLGDHFVGEPSIYGWVLAADQSGTIIADLAAQAERDAKNSERWQTLEYLWFISESLELRLSDDDLARWQLVFEGVECAGKTWTGGDLAEIVDTIKAEFDSQPDPEAIDSREVSHVQV